MENLPEAEKESITAGGITLLPDRRYRLSRDEEEYDQRTVSVKLSDIADLQKVTKTQFKRSKPVKDIARENKISEQLVWSILLEGKEDEERTEAIKRGPFDRQINEVTKAEV